MARWFVIVEGEQQIYLFMVESNLVGRICYAGDLLLQAASSSELSGVIGNGRLLEGNLILLLNNSTEKRRVSLMLF